VLFFTSRLNTLPKNIRVLQLPPKSLEKPRLLAPRRSWSSCIGGGSLESGTPGRGRRIPAPRERQGRQTANLHLPKPVMEALEAHLQGQNDGYIFEGRDQGHISTRQIQRLLDEAAENAGLQETRMGKMRQRKRITPHLLRHSFSRWSLDAGIDISYLQHQLGHSSLTTTAIYLQARPNHRRKAYEKAGFDKLLSPH